MNCSRDGISTCLTWPSCLRACRMGRQPAARVGLQSEALPEPDADDAGLGTKSIYDREDDYRRRRLDRIISPVRNDAFAMGDQTPDGRVRTYADIMREQQLQREMDNTMANIAAKKKKEAEQAAAAEAAGFGAPPAPAPAVGSKRRNRWDQSVE
eukprot:360672-Chlamydomonas_euryale.AAC.18